MTSKDDDTMPLPGLSQEFTPDVTVDEDFIPASQPHSTTSSRTSRNVDSSINKSTEEIINPHATSVSRIDDTLPREAIIDQSTQENNKSADFILDTETKKVKMNYANENVSCRKKLAEFDPQGAFEVQMNPTWEGDVSRIPESPSNTQNFSIVKESPTEALPSKPYSPKKSEESIMEIIVNDSAETVDLDATPVKIKKTESEEKREFYCSSDVDRGEDTQIFDNSSVLLLDQPGPSGLGLENSEGIGEVVEKCYLQETVDDNKENSQDRANGSDLQSSLALAVDEFSRNVDPVKEETSNMPKPMGANCQNEVQFKSNCTEPSNNAVAIRKMDFKLVVSCLVSVNTVTKKILQKSILDVKKTLKSKPNPQAIEQPSDNASEKSKRHSTSSSGSVYSDKTGLPFALPKRLSVISDQTDSSEDDFKVQVTRGRRKHERTPWSNEYLFSLAMDDIIQSAIENEEFLKRPDMSSPLKPKKRHCSGVNQLKEILESSSSSQTSIGDSAVGEPLKIDNTEDKMEGNSETFEKSVPEVEKTNEGIEESIRNETEMNSESENVQCDNKRGESENELETVEKTPAEEEATLISLKNGLAVFARWTDKRYYSGVLFGDVKNDRREVKFDDGTSKAVREDFIMPADWLKVGALVFALVDDKYVSGQIINIKRGKEVVYVVELDTEKKEVSVKISDLCLTDVMAGIVREKYKPLSGTPRGTADIDFDNVLSGKRLREQRTPLKPTVAAGGGSSELKKKSSKSKKDKKQNLQPIKETSQNKSSELKIAGLKSDNGHLIEDKIISADSPSENDAKETPVRKTSKGLKGNVKPRSLSYETEEARLGKGKKSWLTSDGTPIPGPSGVKSKRQKAKAKPEEPENTFTEETEQMTTRSSKKTPVKPPQLTEKSKKKRKLEEFDEENVQKKLLKEGNRKAKTKSRKA